MNLLKKLYDKDQLAFTITWIVAYVILMSLGDNISNSIGIEKIVTVFIGLLLSLTLFLFFKRNNLLKTYGLCKPDVHPKKFLYYIPCIIFGTINIWFGMRKYMHFSVWLSSCQDFSASGHINYYLPHYQYCCDSLDAGTGYKTQERAKGCFQRRCRIFLCIYHFCNKCSKE